jgi:hypothetical protein
MRSPAPARCIPRFWKDADRYAGCDLKWIEAGIGREGKAEEGSFLFGEAPLNVAAF